MKVEKIKSKVLKIYPDAYVMEHHDDVTDLSEFCIIKEPYKGQWRGSYVISCWWYNKDTAWVSAWESIQLETLKKFEG
jgi:hypothetical protein